MIASTSQPLQAGKFEIVVYYDAVSGFDAQRYDP